MIETNTPRTRIKIDMRAHLSPSVVEEIIRETVEKQTGKKVADVEFETPLVTRGYGAAEHDAYVFSGVKITFSE